MILISVPNPTHPNIFGWKFEDSQILDSGNYRPWHVKGSVEQNRKTEGGHNCALISYFPHRLSKARTTEFPTEKTERNTI